MTAYAPKIQLKEPWHAPSEKDASDDGLEGFRLAQDAGLLLFQLFAGRLKRHLKGIVSSAQLQLNTSILEGINNHIKTIRQTP